MCSFKFLPHCKWAPQMGPWDYFWTKDCEPKCRVGSGSARGSLLKTNLPLNQHQSGENSITSTALVWCWPRKSIFLPRSQPETLQGKAACPLASLWDAVWKTGMEGSLSLVLDPRPAPLPSGQAWPLGVLGQGRQVWRAEVQTRILEWVAISFSRGSSRPRDQAEVSCIAGRFFTI